MDVGRCRNRSGIRHQFSDLIDIKRVFGGQQMTQRVGHRILTFVSGQMQNLHVHFVSHFFGMSGPQRVPRQAKTAGRKHLFAVPVVRKRARFADQRIDDVPIVDGRQLLADQTRHRLNHVSVMRHRDVFGTDSQIHQLTDQPTGNRIRVRPHTYRAAAADPHVGHDVVRVQPGIRQSAQLSRVFEILLLPVVVGSTDQVFHEVHILFAALEVPAAAQHQCLINAILQVAVGRFDIAVLVGTPSVRAFRFAVVVTHQRRVSLGQLPATGMIPHGRRQRITAVPSGHTAEIPECLLDTCAQCLKRFRKTQRHTFHIAVRQHAVKEHVVKTLSGNPDAQIVAHSEVTGRETPGVMFLIEEHRLPRPVQTSPPIDATLQRATRRIRKLPAILLLQPFENRLRLEPRFRLQLLFHFRPDTFKRIHPRAIRPHRLLPLRRQPVPVAVFACRFLTHLRHPRRILQRPAQPQQPPQFLHPSVLDHRNLLENQELR